MAIRPSNYACVDFKDQKGKMVDWLCLEYVLKNPQTYEPFIVCNGIGKLAKPKNKKSNNKFLLYFGLSLIAISRLIKAKK